MTAYRVRVRELAGWDLDAYEYRPLSLDLNRLSGARKDVARRQPFRACEAVLAEATSDSQSLLSAHASRDDLHVEMEGLNWTLGVIDLRALIAFQRRLALDPRMPHITIPPHGDQEAMIDLAFGPSKDTAYGLVGNDAGAALTLQTSDPNLHLRRSKNTAAPLIVHGGSPFFEVASYRGRWFLRDGYHRAYALLSARIFEVPAVVIHAETLDELGAVQPWFFSEEMLFSSTPPYVTDFLEDSLVLEYARPALVKTIRVTIEETFAPATPGETL